MKTTRVNTINHLADQRNALSRRVLDLELELKEVRSSLTEENPHWRRIIAEIIRTLEDAHPEASEVAMDVLLRNVVFKEEN